jgi:hypothetical protein
MIFMHERRPWMDVTTLTRTVTGEKKAFIKLIKGLLIVRSYERLAAFDAAVNQFGQFGEITAYYYGYCYC